MTEVNLRDRSKKLTKQEIHKVLLGRITVTDNKELNPLKVSKRNAENFRQRKISLIAKDLQQLAGVDPRITAKVLMARGVPRLHNTRHELMALRDLIKSQLSKFYVSAGNPKILPRPNKKRVPKEVATYYRLLGVAEGLNMAMQDIENILMQKSWQMPINDEAFEKLLRASASELQQETK